MLTRISIQNFAISSAADVELQAGMTVLTGETGAGKSILIDALNLVLGDRAESGLVRHGCERATIHASFELDMKSPAMAWLKAHEMDHAAGDDHAGECQLRRVIGAEGRSRAFINDIPCNLSSLRELGEMLVEIHGQHEHQGLTRPDHQLRLLDSTGNHEKLLDEVRSTAARIKTQSRALAKLQARVDENKAQVELIRYQLQELEALNISAIDVPAVLREHDQASHAEAILQTSQTVAYALKDDDDASISRQIGQLIAQLAPWLESSDEIRASHDLLNEIASLIEEAGRNLQRLEQRLEVDPRRTKELDELLTGLHDLSRKHAAKIEALPQLYEDKLEQLKNIDQSESNLQELRESLAALQDAYENSAEKLHRARHKAAKILSEKVTAHMQSLGMSGGRFQIVIDKKTGSHYSGNGIDEINFLVSANPGQPLQTLKKVASGGELSRISLAINVVSATASSTPSLIFDEVDSGIGGGIAEVVGRELQALGEKLQVLCVTHLPQVAALGHHHFRVVKTSTDKTTESKVIKLDGEARVQEIARMLGGVEITEQSLQHAQQLLSPRKRRSA